MTCRTCKWLDVKPDRNGRIRPTKNSAYPCLVPLPNIPAMPKSVRFDYKPMKSFMCPEYGEGCEFHSPRK